MDLQNTRIVLIPPQTATLLELASNHPNQIDCVNVCLSDYHYVVDYSWSTCLHELTLYDCQVTKITLPNTLEKLTIDRCFRLQLCQNISDLQGLRFLRIYNTRSQRLNLKQLNKLVVLGFKNCDIQNAIIPSGIKELLVVNSVIQQ